MVKIEIGNLVQLKSGGPEMVVTGFYIDAEGFDKTERVYCVWHDMLQNEQSAVYPTSGLVKVQNKK